jgi:hypothetical protein
MVSFPPQCGGVRSERYAAAGMVTSSMLEHLHPFAFRRERVKMLAKTKSWSRFREQMRAEAALASASAGVR